MNFDFFGKKQLYGTAALSILHGEFILEKRESNWDHKHMRLAQQSPPPPQRCDIDTGYYAKIHL